MATGQERTHAVLVFSLTLTLTASSGGGRCPGSKGCLSTFLKPPHLLRVEVKGSVCRASLKLSEMTPSRYRNTQAIRDIDGSDKV
jgi:hypothetical protein